MEKIFSFGEILNQLPKNKETILCCGEFDMMHIGHIKYFQEAKNQADILIVCVTPDRYIFKGIDRPVFNEKLRAESIASLECVDFVIINEYETAVELIELIKPTYYAKGIEYQNKEDITGRLDIEIETLTKNKGIMIFLKTECSHISSSNLINNIVLSDEIKQFMKQFKKESLDIIKKLDSLKDLKVSVIGEHIVDVYAYCYVMGKSPKSDILTSKYLYENEFDGGATATSRHVSNFCNNIYYEIKNESIIKKRYIDEYKFNKLFELCTFPEIKPITNFDFLIGQDICIVNDFGHGLINSKSANTIFDVCYSNKVKLTVNTQTNSANTGFNLITKYPYADFICLDLHEAQLALHDNESNPECLIKKLSISVNCHKIILTLGKRGCITWSNKEGYSMIPAFSKSVIDTTGAGDAYLALAGMSAHVMTMKEAGFLGNVIGALKCQIKGNERQVTEKEVKRQIEVLMNV